MVLAVMVADVIGLVLVVGPVVVVEPVVVVGEDVGALVVSVVVAAVGSKAHLQKKKGQSK